LEHKDRDTLIATLLRIKDLDPLDFVNAACKWPNPPPDDTRWTKAVCHASESAVNWCKGIASEALALLSKEPDPPEQPTLKEIVRRMKDAPIVIVPAHPKEQGNPRLTEEVAAHCAMLNYGAPKGGWTTPLDPLDPPIVFALGMRYARDHGYLSVSLGPKVVDRIMRVIEPLVIWDGTSLGPDGGDAEAECRRRLSSLDQG